MEYGEAIEKVKQGVKCRCVLWKEGVFIYKDEIWLLSDEYIKTPVIFQMYAPGRIVPYTATQLDYFAEWEEV
jgi:hypothetical protein